MGTQNRGFVAAVLLTGLVVIAAQSPAWAEYRGSAAPGAAGGVQEKIMQPIDVNKSGTEPPSNRMLTSSSKSTMKVRQYDSYSQELKAAKRQQAEDRQRDVLQKERDKRAGQNKGAEGTSTSGGNRGNDAAKGAAVGAAVGGPVGAAIGAVVGGASGGGSQNKGAPTEKAPMDTGDSGRKKPEGPPRQWDQLLSSGKDVAPHAATPPSGNVQRARNCTNC
jgi:hypothetical protein